MESINPQHVREPGLVVLDITAADEATAQLVMASLEQRWATSGITAIRRLPGVPGVRVWVYADTRRRGPEPDRADRQPAAGSRARNRAKTWAFDRLSLSAFACDHEGRSAL
ncbi:DUF6207 family protein (plasmid) [Streptomyces laculatispora]|uniref:DUF6207 family protein n=1 Tax=Streptomyces laculatispora TaxID=887464 RepID=A0ABY9IFA8_9ACTN|nr:DUF6207 family protein [Streptomyces laculatispora]WLQ45621.1 DUF6207 family protein [Streptomyces laculatispora]